MVLGVVALETIEEMDTGVFATSVVRNLFLLSPNFALTYGLITIVNQGLEVTSVGDIDWDVMTASMIIMIIEGAVFFYLVLFIDTRCSCKYCRRLVCCCCRGSDTQTQDFGNEDEDVLRERERVLNDGDSCSLRVNELHKRFDTWSCRGSGCTKRSKVAVKSVTFGCSKGSCFGLIGPNGAGKTTVLSMLSGETSVTSGDAFLDGQSVHILNVRGQIKNLGFCPQQDALIELMTVREHLELYPPHLMLTIGFWLTMGSLWLTAGC